MRFSLVLLLFFCVIKHTTAQDSSPQLISWQQIAAMPIPPANHKISYGPDSLQYGELRLPEGKGKFPVVVVVHGGCWLSAYNLQYMSHLSQELTQQGYATWNIEFRRVGDPGGAWPGSLQDVALATDYVRELAKNYPLDTKKVAVIGHSAGGHLALWLAARKQLPKSSPLYTRKPLKLKGVVALAGIPDLVQYSSEKGSCNAAVSQLMGGTPAQLPALYAQASPQQMLPLQVPSRLIQGALDPIVPVSQAQNFVDKNKTAGSDSQLILLPQAGHFDLVVPSSPVWPQVLEAVKSIL
ncbi:alpha/beta fold hydrolase [uncultured Pontibacter sp.]|uniref:alpha/beta hydrolase family protein n=1 Tax=uncultured Pontibacter sp. TaxID=453356 RepID=UPI0026228733|nr:alpha/beta fold hydrolase [uncultured Pontibacter sp.]